MKDQVFPSQAVDPDAARQFSPHAMPKVDPATHRLLCKVLGRQVAEVSAPKTELPPDVLSEISKVIGENRELKEQLPRALDETARAREEMAAVRAEIQSLKGVVEKILNAVGGNRIEIEPPPEPRNDKRQRKQDPLPPAEK